MLCVGCWRVVYFTCLHLVYISFSWLPNYECVIRSYSSSISITLSRTVFQNLVLRYCESCTYFTELLLSVYIRFYNIFFLVRQRYWCELLLLPGRVIRIKQIFLLSRWTSMRTKIIHCFIWDTHPNLLILIVKILNYELLLITSTTYIYVSNSTGIQLICLHSVGFCRLVGLFAKKN